MGFLRVRWRPGLWPRKDAAGDLVDEHPRLMELANAAEARVAERARAIAIEEFTAAASNRSRASVRAVDASSQLTPFIPRE